ncbi:MAG TPA: molybdopterin cofactor-binding domain-containing protein [Stellaceae bacterium]|nr:molybdopterin cofactor-binding domain-containing protein [Stellaceae bacterium]
MSGSEIRFGLNGKATAVMADPRSRLADVLRDALGLTGTKIGCNAGDCGACTILLDGAQVCACLLAVGQVAGRTVTTVEGLAKAERLSALQEAFQAHGAAQCGICTPGMLMAASELLIRNSEPDEEQVLDALGGVLCRCTGYRKIVEAVLDVSRAKRLETPPDSRVVGARLPKVDGIGKLTGAERYGADEYPADSLVLRAVRSPHHHARFQFGDWAVLRAKYPGLVQVLTSQHILGQNRYGIYPTGKDQPVFAEGYVRHRGEAVCALVGDAETITAITDDELPILWEKLPALTGVDAALDPAAPHLHAEKPGNILVEGRLVTGDVDSSLATADLVVDGVFETSFVEHAYIEPEAGYARRVGDRIEIFATTQSPYMDRDEIALIMGIEPTRVRIIPSAVGGGFGGKLDLSVQPMIATAAWLTNRPVRCVYTRPESMASTTKRHPARIAASLGAARDGRFLAVRFSGDFNTGAYASWGPTVANRVPVHAMGPYRISAARCVARAIHTNDTPAGAFRGFGVPQAAIAVETLVEDVAERLGIDPLELRYRNALEKGCTTATGQLLSASVGLRQCFDALRSQWQRERTLADEHNAGASHCRRGVGIACGWYGIGNTSLPNPSTMRVALARDGRFTLYSGAVDIGQGSNTVMTQIVAETLGVPLTAIRLVSGDTDLTADAGKTSASRQTFVSGAAARLAAENLRRQILRLANVGDHAKITSGDHILQIADRGVCHEIDLRDFAVLNEAGDLLTADGYFDPPTTPLDAEGQGIPYATYSFSAQIAVVEVDVDLGTVKVLRMVAAADVGRAINPIQVEGQIHGGIAQGLGLALMEEFVPGRTENLHDYLIPTIGDVPPIETIIIEDPEPLGPYGAKGIGEPSLVPTAPAILNAIRHATGVRITRVPATPDRVRAALCALGGSRRKSP